MRNGASLRAVGLAWIVVGFAQVVWVIEASAEEGARGDERGDEIEVLEVTPPGVVESEGVIPGGIVGPATGYADDEGALGDYLLGGEAGYAADQQARFDEEDLAIAERAGAELSGAIEIGAIKPLNEILPLVPAEHPGAIVAAEIGKSEEAPSGWIYVLAMITADGVVRAAVDAATGQIIETGLD